MSNWYILTLLFGENFPIRFHLIYSHHFLKTQSSIQREIATLESSHASSLEQAIKSSTGDIVRELQKLQEMNGEEEQRLIKECQIRKQEV